MEQAMSDNLGDQAFEQFLHDAIASRPEPAAPADLARIAMRLAAADPEPARETLSQIARIDRQNRLMGFFAAAMIAAVLLLGCLRLWSHGGGSNSATDWAATDSLQSISSTDASESEFSKPMVLLTGEALLAELILLSVGGAAINRSGASASDLVFH
jgi:ferric-dicitrate binding protein FerR (iron transport regulator)